MIRNKQSKQNVRYGKTPKEDAPRWKFYTDQHNYVELQIDESDEEFILTYIGRDAIICWRNTSVNLKFFFSCQKL